MGKSLLLGNNNVLIGLDKFAQVYDFYYPYVGLEDHTLGGFTHKIGVWVENKFSWFEDESWQIDIDYQANTQVSKITALNSNLNVRVDFTDVVCNEKDIFLREVKVTNLEDRQREVRIFFNQEFEIYESFRGDTALFDHTNNVIIHYKGRRVFLINTLFEGRSFDDYSVGLLGIEGHEGTFKDAEDGVLEKGNVEHGLVDSVISVHLNLEARQTKTLHYWMTASKSIPDAYKLNKWVLEKTPQYLIETTGSYWKAWLTKENWKFVDPKPEYLDLFKKSLLIIDTHIGNNGSVIASGDSHLLKMGRGTYSYLWPRDAAFVVMSMSKAGYTNPARKLMDFCATVIGDEGYLLHKYRADTSLGSSWHPWVREGKSELPIQEDETALILVAFWDYYQYSRDIEFVEKHFEKLIKNPANFMTSYRNKETGLPLPTYDLWEEKFGVSTFTSSTVYSALIAASSFAQILGETELAKKWNEAAEEIKTGILKYLYDENLGCFVKQINYKENGLEYDKTIDISSIYGILKFNILPYSDQRVAENMKLIEERLTSKTDIGGIGRYENDYYFRSSMEIPGNPWIISTLWLAEYYLKKATTIEELAPVYEKMDWVIKHAQKSGVLSEQINPYTGYQLSATPLIWSQAQWVEIFLELNEKLAILKGFKPNITYASN